MPLLKNAFIVLLAAAFFSTRAQEFPSELYNKLIYTNPDSALRITRDYYQNKNYVKQDTGNLLNMMGGAAWAKGDLINAAAYFTNAIEWYEKKDAQFHIRLTKLNLGNVFNDLEAYSLAERYYRESMFGEEDKSDAINNLGTVLFRKGQLDSAEACFREAMHLYGKVDNIHGVMLAFSNLAKLYVKRGAIDTAGFYLNCALFLSDSLNDLKMYSTTLETAARFHLQKEDFPKALSTAHNALNISKNRGFKEAHRDASLTLSDIHKATRAYDSALYYLEKATVIDDSLKKNSSTDISSLITNYYEERSAREKAVAQLEILTLRNDIIEERNFRNIIIFITLVIATGAFTGWRFMQLRVKKQKLAMALQAKQAENVQYALENERIEAEQVKERLHFKEKELLTLALKEAEIQNLLKELKQEMPSGLREENAQRITSLLKSNIAKNNQWEEFKTRFENIHESFFIDLTAKHPDLSPKELKLCALTFLNLSAKEIADIQGIKPSSVDIARHRLRKKLNLSGEQSLIEYLRSFSN